MAGPSLATALMFAALIALGFWQVHRLAWKEGLLAQIDAAERHAPVPLGGAVPPPFAKVAASGRFRPGEFAYYGAEVRDEKLGAQLLQLLDRAGGLKPLLVDLGWVPTEGAPPLLTGEASVEGYARPAEQAGFLSAPDTPAQRRFFALDPAKIGAALGAPDVAPFTLVRLGKDQTGVPIPAASLPRPPNNHLQYALTWFALAVILLVTYGVWLRRALMTR